MKKIFRKPRRILALGLVLALFGGAIKFFSGGKGTAKRTPTPFSETHKDTTQKQPPVFPPIDLTKERAKGKARALASWKAAKNTNVFKIIREVANEFKLPFLAIVAKIDRESSLAAHGPIKNKDSSATGAAQITDETIIDWVALHGRRCIPVVSRLDPQAAETLRRCTAYMSWKAGKAVLHEDRYNADCARERNDLLKRWTAAPPKNKKTKKLAKQANPAGQKALPGKVQQRLQELSVSLKELAGSLRKSNAASIALACAYAVEANKEMVSLFKPKQADFLDPGQLDLLDINGASSDPAFREGYSFLLWMRHLWGDTRLRKMLAAPADTPMIEILAGERPSPKKYERALKTLKDNSFPENSTVKRVFQLMAVWYETTRLGHRVCFAGDVPVTAFAEDKEASRPTEAAARQDAPEALAQKTVTPGHKTFRAAAELTASTKPKKKKTSAEARAKTAVTDPVFPSSKNLKRLSGHRLAKK